MKSPDKVIYCAARDLRPGDRVRRPVPTKPGTYEYRTVKDVWYAFGNSDVLQVSYEEGLHFSCLTVEDPVMIIRRETQ